MKNENETTNPLTIREKMTIYLVIALIKVIKPFEYKHELDEALKEVKECIKREKFAD